MDYPLSGYSHGYGMEANIIFIQRSGHKYHIIVHGYSFTSKIEYYWMCLDIK